MLIKTECELYEAVARRQTIYYRYAHKNVVASCTNPRIAGNFSGEPALYGDWSDSPGHVTISSALEDGRLATSAEDLNPIPIRVGMCVGSRNKDGTPATARYIILAFDDNEILGVVIPSGSQIPQAPRGFRRKDGETLTAGYISLDLKKEITL